MPDRGADQSCAGAPVQEKHRGDDSTCASGAPTSRGFYWGCASAQDQGGCCGRYARGTTGSAEKAGLLGLALGLSSALGRFSLWRCVIIVVIRLAQWTLWASTSRVSTSTTCLVLRRHGARTSHGGASASDC